MPIFHMSTVQWIAYLFVVVVQAVLFLRWLYRKMRADDVQRAFVHDMATNHLPHMYSALRQIANAQGIELEEPPPIRFIEFNGKGK